MKKIILTFIAFVFFSISIKAQEINWISLNKALELQKENPKKIMIDIYTNWCGPCKLLDKKTFKNKDVAAYVNEHYYAVKFNGEGNEAINYKDTNFGNPNYDASKANSRNSAHEFADYMGVNAYPTIAFLNETGDFIAPIRGFHNPQQLEFFLKLFVTNKHIELKTKETLGAYYKAFEPKFKG
ncbi:thioredoxin family protein [Polaribacter litorisediminis]|uniref:thioredoxin family protein n=1 Tax=Polaribacter litorisediminis TaxID=1908341 RepID=UPI001CBB6359|nr:thioredoxin family protein [Polaribacter litorisediminis]UAM98704.1 thioredoxin family protein [Polaribacter litorisediminis]